MTNKVALITGSGKRIGKAICQRLAADGFDLALHYLQSKTEALALQAELEATGIATSLHHADLSSEDDIKQLVDEVSERWGRLDVLVNSASMFCPLAVDDCDSNSLQDFYQVNAIGPMLLCKHLFTLLQQANVAHIINITDIYAERPLRNHIPYAMSKAALAMMTKSLAVEWAADGIRVNAVAPGAMLLPEGTSPEAEKSLVSRIPLGQLGGVEEIANAVSYLAHSEFVTGQTLVIDGGRSLAP